MRYFRTIPQVYTAVRAALDAAWGHPKVAVHEVTATDVVTTSCLPLVENALQKEGVVYVALPESMISWEEVQAQISALVSGGQIEEIDEQTFLAALPVPQL